MDRLEALDRIGELLDAPVGNTTNTSMRLPDTLREAAALAVAFLDIAPSATTLTSDALRHALETAVIGAGLDAYFAEYPDARPTLAQVALALAQQDGSPLADDPEALERAAAEVQQIRPGADADDVLLWAAAQRAVGR